MNIEQFYGPILLTLICVLLALGLWYIGLTRNIRAAKPMAVMIGVTPVIGFGLQVAGAWMGWGHVKEFRDGAAGPASREASIVREGPMPVNRPNILHELELTPKTRGGDPPTKPVRLRYVIRTPKGEILAQGEQELPPAPRLRWAPLRAQFRPTEEGEHSLAIDIPNPVGSVDIIVRELDQ